MIAAIPRIDAAAREILTSVVKAKEKTPLPSILIEEVNKIETITDRSKEQFNAIVEKLPLAYNKVNAIFSTMERKSPGDGGIFSIFVSDLCKGCGECVTECGDHDALRMESDTEENNARVLTASAFLDILPETNTKYLGLYKPDAPEDSRPAALRNLMMMTGTYKALASGDGACAGCGEKSVLHALASVTEAYMRPLYHDEV
jgi:pyruvate-ferredoxin/flavodoxin oxidoreductase